MARVVLHCGFHKSGTTTIQAAIRAAAPTTLITVPSEGFWTGPHLVGHRALGLMGYAARPEALVEAIDAAAASARQRETVVPVVLSTESLMGSLRFEGGAPAIHRLVRAHEVELVLTIMDARTRLPSVVQQRAKGGRLLDPVTEDDLRTLVQQHYLFREGVVAAMVEPYFWSAAHVVVTERAAPDHLFEAFERIIGGPLPRGADLNASWPSTSVHRMLRLNRLLGEVTAEPPEDLRRRLPTGAGMGDPALGWHAARSRELEVRQHIAKQARSDDSGAFRLEVPADLEAHIARVWASRLEEVARLERAGRLTVHRAPTQGSPIAPD